MQNLFQSEDDSASLHFLITFNKNNHDDDDAVDPVVVLGFFIWALTGRECLFRRGVKGGLRAEGAKLRLPMARSASRLGGLSGPIFQEKFPFSG